MLFFSVLSAMTVSAQTVNIHFQNGTTINLHEDLIESIDFSEKTPEPTLTAGEAVDLGLSVMWASCNLGATSPSESGGYYAWGETETKSSYTEKNYAYYNTSTASYTDIGSDISGAGYDAATANLGKGWRMPTYNEMNELVKKCTWTWSQVNGVNGYLVTGTNGNSIFLPAVGEKGFLSSDDALYYWTSSKYEYNATSARNLYAFSSGYGLNYNGSNRPYYVGNSIRPVISYDDHNGTTDYDDSAVISNISAYYGGGSIMSNSGTILSGSKLNFFFKNGSSEEVTMTGIYLIDGNGSEGSNMLTTDVAVPAGDTPGYTITLGKNMTSPKCRFTYRYNNHTYSVEAAYQSFNMAKGKMRELKAE